MSDLRESARRCLERLGQRPGQVAGQAAEMPVPHDSTCPMPVGHEKPQETAKNGSCPTVPPSRDRDTGTGGLIGGTRRGTSCGTSGPLDERIATARLREWYGRLSRLDQFCSPPGWTLDRWLTLIDAALWLYENFASQAVREGWSALNLWGVYPAMPRAGGLADRLGDARNLKLSDGRAYWSSFGVKQQFCRGGAIPGLVPLWELGQ